MIDISTRSKRFIAEWQEMNVTSAYTAKAPARRNPYCRMADGVGIVVFPAALEEPEDTEADEERSYQNRISGNECHSSFS